MKKTFRKTSAMLCAITVMASSMSFSSFVANADGEPVTSDYTLTIPATLAVANSGWNATAGISATGTLATGKKLVVTASSDSEFALVSGENMVNYKLAESGNTETTYANATEKTSWEFTALSETATTQPMGIVVEDYSSKPAGTYQDTVTFTASVESSATKLTSTTTSWSDGNYIATENVSISRVTVGEDVNLTINDGVTVTITDGMTISNGKTLTINGQSAGTGNLTVKRYGNYGNISISGGTLIVNSGNVVAKGGSGYSSNMDGGQGGVAISSALIVNGGTVNATGGSGANGGSYSGMGARAWNGGNGGNGISGTLTVNGGMVTATGGSAGNSVNGGSAGTLGKGITGTINAGTGYAVEGSTDNSTWSDASTNYNTYQYLRIIKHV